MLPRIVRPSAAVPAALLLALLAAPASAGPPWVSIEYPVNPFDRDTRGALVLVHTYHHGVARQFPVVGAAEGYVSGKRQRIALEVVPTSRTGVWAVRGELPRGTAWVVSATMTDTETNSLASALVALTSEGQLSAVQVPHRVENGWVVPRAATRADVDALLRTSVAAARNQASASTRPIALAGLGMLLLPAGLVALARRRRAVDR